ncbi:MAG: carboxylating nicotinate-nucleotide diphosphorylase [Gemmatimonadaceae bacterium]|nr:carboxylating nicotinate-nucleotide diphosphorylase [Gemmatimonadaceae bacterium]
MEHRCRSCPPSAPAGASTYTSFRFPLDAHELTRRVQAALDEDRAFDDVTTIATVQSDRRARARLVARQPGVVCGVPFAIAAFQAMDDKCSIRVDAEDGATVKKGDTVLFMSGHARSLLSAERVALNFLQRMSGIATLTSRYVLAVQGTRARILDTRKTTPGWRSLEKYSVRCGGGSNHRLDLAAAVLIKDNHLMAVNGDVGLAIRRCRDLAEPGALVEVECDRLEQVAQAAEHGADIILLDNMPPVALRECVDLVAGRAKTEASGGVSLDTVRAIAGAGVDYISVGALTHSPPALNLALDFE